VSQVQDIYAVLLSRDYARTGLFLDLKDQRQEGREVRAACPLCADAGHHFSYNLEKPLWTCYATGDGGDWLRYLERRGFPFKEALAFLAREAGVELDGADQAGYQVYTRKADLLEAAHSLFRETLTSPAGEPVLRYLEARGYSREDAEAMELGAYADQDALRETLTKAGYGAEELEATGLFASYPWTKTPAWLTVLWRDQAGRPLGFVGRPPLSNEEREPLKLRKYHYAKGLEKSQGFSGLSFTQATRGGGSVLVVEGVLDALFLNVRGAEPKAVSIGGTTPSDAQVAALARVGTREVLLALDQDGPGQDATLRLVQKLRRETDLRPLVVSWPADFKDPDELVRAAGIDALQKAMEQAEAWPRWLARHLVSQHDSKTDRGLELALAEACKVYGQVSDPLEQRQYREALAEATGLPLEELEPRLARQAAKAGAERAGAVLTETLRDAQAKATGGDLPAAETALVAGLEKLRQARGVSVPEPYLVEDLERDILTAKDGLHTGYAALDKLLSVPQGAITIVAGRPGHGKTTLQLNLLARMLKAYPELSFAFFSYEESRRALALKLVMLEAGEVLSEAHNFGHFLRYFKEERQTRPAIEQAVSRYEEWTSSGRLLLSDQRLTAEDLSSTIGHLAGQGPLGAVFVDYIQKVPLQASSTSQRYLEVQRVSGLLLDAAVRQDIPLVLGAQLGRDPQAKDKVRLDNLRESGDIEQDANLVLGLLNKAKQQEEDSGEAAPARVELDVRVLKNRAGRAETSASLVFDRPTLRILDKATDPSLAAFV